MPTFVHPALLWGLAGAAIPVLIHLINMMRHRRVEWAAMEFLLVSQKKHRTWIIFKQLLLLLLRMAAVAAVVAMVAQPRLRGHLSNLLGGVRTHHIVLLDDSFSMSDRWADTDAFAEAKKAVERLAENAVRQDRLQSFTLLRFSRADRPSPAPDMLKEPVTSEFDDKLESVLDKLNASQTAVGPLPSLKAVGELLGDGADEHRIYYLISDFRTRQWGEPEEIRKALLPLGEARSEIHLVDCVDRRRPNLAIVSLAPVAGIRAAGVSWFMDVAVRNYGESPARQVTVALGEDGHGRSGVTLAEIPAGRTAKERFEVRLSTAGAHRITARLESDAVAADNHRHATIELPADLPALLVDSDPRGRDARFLNFALAPGEPVRTGIRPRIETPRYLSTKPLSDFRTIDLTNVERLDRSAVEALEKFTADGGGVVFFLGERTDVRFFNDVLYRNGHGLFPVPLAGEKELLVDRLEPAPDVEVDPHFIFRVFTGKQNSLLQTVAVSRYFAVASDWRPTRESGVRVAARLRNGAPLVVDRDYGRGRVVAFLTTASPTWNNWARNPSFVVVMQDLQAYLASRPGQGESRTVGSPITLQLDPAEYEPQIRFNLPEESAIPPVAVQAERGADGLLTATLADTPAAGFYEAQLTRTGGAVESRQYAVNVDPAEGDLAVVNAEQIADGLKGVKYDFTQAASFQLTPSEMGGSHLGDIILYALIVLLIGEQLLAWSAGYHPPRGRRPAKGGVR